MNKPESLKQHLLASVPALKNNPDRLLIFVDNGKVSCTMAAGYSFEYGYELQIILTEFPGHPDSVFLPIISWLRVNQSELLANLEKSAEGIQFEADILNKDMVDLSIKLQLTERVVVLPRPAGGHDVTHPDEPQYTEQIDVDGPIEFYAKGELINSWTPPKPTEALLLESPHPKPRNHG